MWWQTPLVAFPKIHSPPPCSSLRAESLSSSMSHTCSRGRIMCPYQEGILIMLSQVIGIPFPHCDWPRGGHVDKFWPIRMGVCAVTSEKSCFPDKEMLPAPLLLDVIPPAWEVWVDGATLHCRKCWSREMKKAWVLRDVHPWPLRLRALMLLHLRTSPYVEITNMCILQQRGLMLSRTFSQKHLNGLRYETLW